MKLIGHCNGILCPMDSVSRIKSIFHHTRICISHDNFIADIVCTADIFYLVVNKNGLFIKQNT